MEHLLQRYPVLSRCREEIAAARELMLQTYRMGGKILLCGNGGSCADCDHIVGELMKGFLSRRKMEEHDRERLFSLCGEEGAFYADSLQYGIPALSLAGTAAVNSAFNNDVEPALVYAQGVWAMGQKNDLLIGLSTSGNSENVINALITAKTKGLKSLGLTGAGECAMDRWCDTVIHVPERETFKIQELHLPVYHYLCATMEAELFV